MTKTAEEYLERIADALEALVKFNTPFPVLKYGDDAKAIVDTLKVEEKTIHEDKKTKTTQQILPGMHHLDVSGYKDITPKAYVVVRDDGQEAVLPKSLISNIVEIEEKEVFRVFFTEKAQKWFSEDKVEWKEAEKR